MMTVACVILPAAAAVREKERGTIEQLLVSPLSPLQILFAKCASMVLVTVIGTALSVFAVMHPFFGTPLRGSARAYAMLDDEIREELVVEPDEPVISHALDVTDGGEATAAWLTPSGVWAARYAPRRGWSTPERLHALDLELESSWDTWQLSSPPPHWDDYPMQLRRSSDGRELIVWSQYEALVTKMGSDYWYREATASSVWSLIVAGSSTHLQRLSAADD